MPYNTAIQLDQISESQSGKAATANDVLAAMATAALFGIKASATSGLTLTLYGGNLNISGVPTAVATQSVVLSASTTNYIYATSAGVVTKTTSIPSGWPGPLAASATALYTLVTGSSGITSGTSYVLSSGPAGAAGAVGAQGPAGTDIAATRKRLSAANGGGSTTISGFGWDASTLTGATATAVSLSSATLRQSIPCVQYLSGAGAGSSAQVHHARNFCYLGNAAGRGGFTLSIRMAFESGIAPAQQRSFFGLFTPATIGNVEPDTLLNCIGIGAKAAEANLSLIHNDGSGTATKTLISSVDSPTVNFPARATDNVYELTFTSVANSGIVTWRIDNINDGTYGTGNVSSDLPSNTTFLTWVLWVNNGTTASAAAFDLMQLVGETRY